VARTVTGHDGNGKAHDAAGRRATEEAIRLLQTLTELTGAHDAPECRICPVCQLLAALRQVRPEAVEHLIRASTELAAALRDLAVPASASPWTPGPRAPGQGTPGQGTATAAQSGPEPTVGGLGLPDTDREPAGTELDPAGVSLPSRPPPIPERPRIQRIDVTD
jgi:hypothetical protein